jgi:hypothetical protein
MTAEAFVTLRATIPGTHVIWEYRHEGRVDEWEEWGVAAFCFRVTGSCWSLLLLNAFNRYPPLEKSYERCTKSNGSPFFVQCHDPVSHPSSKSIEQMSTNQSTPRKRDRTIVDCITTCCCNATMNKAHTIDPSPKATLAHELNACLKPYALTCHGGLHITSSLQPFNSRPRIPALSRLPRGIPPLPYLLLLLLLLLLLPHGLPTYTQHPSSPSSHPLLPATAHGSNAGVHSVPAPSGMKSIPKPR